MGAQRAAEDEGDGGVRPSGARVAGIGEPSNNTARNPTPVLRSNSIALLTIQPAEISLELNQYNF